MVTWKIFVPTWSETFHTNSRVEVISSMQINHILAGKLHEQGGSSSLSSFPFLLLYVALCFELDLLFYFVKDSIRASSKTRVSFLWIFTRNFEKRQKNLQFTQKMTFSQFWPISEFYYTDAVLNTALTLVVLVLPRCFQLGHLMISRWLGIPPTHALKLHP